MQEEKDKPKKAILIVAGNINEVPAAILKQVKAKYGDNFEIITPEQAKERGIPDAPPEKSITMKVKPYDIDKLERLATPVVVPEGKWYNQFNKNKRKRW